MIKSTLLISAVSLTMFNLVNDFQKDFPIPVKIKSQTKKIEDLHLERTKKALTILNAPIYMAENISALSKANNLDPLLIVALIHTESNFKISAQSNKGYKGLMQTKSAMMKPGFEAVDIAMGTCMLKEKLRYSKGNVTKALQLYKGGNNPVALKQAKHVMFVYNKLKIQTKELT